MKHHFLLEVNSEFTKQQVRKIIDNALLFRVEEAIDDIFRNEKGNKVYPEFSYRIKEIE